MCRVCCNILRKNNRHSVVSSIENKYARVCNIRYHGFSGLFLCGTVHGEMGHSRRVKKVTKTYATAYIKLGNVQHQQWAYIYCIFLQYSLCMICNVPGQTVSYIFSLKYLHILHGTREETNRIKTGFTIL